VGKTPRPGTTRRPWDNGWPLPGRKINHAQWTTVVLSPRPAPGRIILYTRVSNVRGSSFPRRNTHNNNDNNNKTLTVLLSLCTTETAYIRIHVYSFSTVVRWIFSHIVSIGFYSNDGPYRIIIKHIIFLHLCRSVPLSATHLLTFPRVQTATTGIFPTGITATDNSRFVILYVSRYNVYHLGICARVCEYPRFNFNNPFSVTDPANRSHSFSNASWSSFGRVNKYVHLFDGENPHDAIARD